MLSVWLEYLNLEGQLKRSGLTFLPDRCGNTEFMCKFVMILTE